MQNEPIAIIGIGCRFPGAENPFAFWRLLSEGRDAIREVPADRWKMEKLYDPDPTKPGKIVSRWGGFLDQIDRFDWRAFHIPPREARYMDPQHRLILEVAWEALEDAGLSLSQVAGSQTSVAIGIGLSDYVRLQSRNWSQIDGYMIPGNYSCFAANRLSYIFDLKGPSISLDAGCSSSLVSVYYACQSLWTGEATLALAGGVNVMASPDGTIMLSKSGLLSPDGRCKTLDAHANGVVRGEGAGIIVLKPLSQVHASDRVYALIRGIAISHNGHNEWMIAPSQVAQEALLRETYNKAGVDPAEIDYVELNGTGFLRGDAIETGAVGAVLGRDERRTHPCLVGSVKTNIGHLEAAAGIASVIKVALSLYHRAIPPTLNFQTINPNIPLQELHLAVPQEIGSWPEKENAPSAGITTTAFTGANAHAVLAAHPVFSDGQPLSNDGQQVKLLPISARSVEALYAQAVAMRDFLLSKAPMQPFWRDICYTASVRRTHHEYRMAVTGSSAQEAAAALDTFIQEQPRDTSSLLRHRKLVFLLAHQNEAPVFNDEFLLKNGAFRSTVNECEQVFSLLTGNSLFKILSDPENAGIDQRIVNPVIHFINQVALSALWRSWGIIPDAVLGEGLGEIAAAYIAGGITLEDALQILFYCVGYSTSLKDLESLLKKLCMMPSSSVTLYSTALMKAYAENDFDRALWKTQLKISQTSVALIDQLLADDHNIFLELGSPTSLSARISVRLQFLKRATIFLSSLLHGRGTNSTLLETLGILYTQGYEVDWSVTHTEKCKCVSLPAYQWQRERLWPDWLDIEEISTAPEDRHTHNGSVEQQSDKAIPNQSIDEMLAELWAKALGLELVKVHESFFELGGHSLLAVQLLGQIRTVFQVELSLGQLLQAPTPAACAELIRQGQTKQTVTMLPLIKPDLSQRLSPFPMTDVQQVYWVGRSTAFEIGNVGNHAYIEVEADALNVERCDMAIRHLIARHEMLRAIILSDGQQQILKHVPLFQTKVVDLGELSQQEVTTQMASIRQQMDHQMLPVEQWPPFQIFTFRCDSQHTRLHLSVESLFFDAWSMNILIQEFIRLYHEPDAELPSLEISFRDYVLAEKALHGSELYQRSQQYWLERLATLPPAPDLPLVSSPSALVQPRFIHRSAQLEKERWQHLKARAAQAGLTPSGVLLAAFAEVLATWSKSSRFSINLSTFNRLPLHHEINSIVGDFTSLLVLAVDFSTSDTFEHKAQRLQAQLWQDLDQSYYSGVQVLRELARQQGSMINAVMPVVFTSLLIQDTTSPYPIPWQETLYCVTQTPQVWLDHQVLETDGALIFHWESVDALFPEGLIDAMFEAYCQLLQRLASVEESWKETAFELVPVAQLEQRDLVNATDAPVSEELLHALFISQVSQRPDQVAVIAPDRTLTYQQLYTGSMQLAHWLRRLGVRPNQLVAVVIEKGWEQVVAVLAILQAGAAYLPIDPHLPNERLCYLLEHGKVEVALTQSRIESKIQWPEHIQRTCVDTVEFELKDVPPLEWVQKPEDLAYVIYTSGSTGLPKGVMIDHRGAVNTILDINQRFNVDCHDRVLALSALNFDLSVYDIFGLLAAGGTIVMPAEGTLRNPAIWLELLLRERVTIWNSVPALLQMLVEFTEAEANALQYADLRLALLSGDWIPLPLPDRIKWLIPDIEVISLGGATEASIWSILYPISTIDPSWKSIPYGRPMLNQQFAVLNERLQPCPVWVPGNLYISGIGLAKGYWRDEQKTQASFFYHPDTGTRLYRTGDLGRYLPDGTIEFLGREDFQIKVQGHRIEIGEIEETLLLHPAVQAVVATALTEDGGGKRLVAYVVLNAQEAASPNGSDVPQKAMTSEAYGSRLLQRLSGPLTSNPVNGHSPGTTQKNQGSYGELRRLELQFGQSSIRENTENKPVIALAGAAIDADTQAKYRERLSSRTFLQEPIPFIQFSDFLGVLRQYELEGLPKYRYPSAGGIYPVQAYLAVKPDCVEGLAGGIYYYNPRSHQLIMLSTQTSLDRSIHGVINQPVFDESAFSLFLIARTKEITEQYGDAARDFCLLEAGYMSQLLMTEAPKHHIGFCPIGGVKFAPIRDAFALEENHMLLHTLLCGRVNPTLSTGWSFLPTSSDASSSLPTHSLTNGTIVSMLRDFLKKKLPEYMIPSAIVVLDALPLTPNGKVDRKNLPIPQNALGGSSIAFVEPKSELEKAIAAVWQEMLPEAKIGLYDNFFDLGGNSLLMVRAYTRLRKIIKRDMSIVEMFFQYPTIQALAEFLSQSNDGQSEQGERSNALLASVEGRKGRMLQQREIRRRHRFDEGNYNDA